MFGEHNSRSPEFTSTVKLQITFTFLLLDGKIQLALVSKTVLYWKHSTEVVGCKFIRWHNLLIIGCSVLDYNAATCLNDAKKSCNFFW